MDKEKDFLRKDFLRRWKVKERPFLVEAQQTTYEAFIDSIEYAEAFPENEGLAIKVIEMLKKKYNLMLI